MILSAIFRSPGVRDELEDVNTYKLVVTCYHCCMLQSYLCDELEGRCKRVVGYLAVYRVLFAVACFYFLFAVMMLCVKNSRDPRSYIQNGYESMWYLRD